MTLRPALILSLLVSLNAYAVNPDGSRWNVVGKRCDSAPLEIVGSEVVLFANGIFARSFRMYEDQNESCYGLKGYGRVIGSFGGGGSSYQESATLLPQVFRTVCKDAKTGALLRDDTVSWSGAPRAMSMALSGSTGTVELHEDEECPSGVLRLELNQPH